MNSIIYPQQLPSPQPASFNLMTGPITPDVFQGPQSLTSTRRIRHIASIQVRNLTPFPVRDAFTSALSQSNDLRLLPADDITMMPSRRRIRTISTNSVSSKSIKWDEGVLEERSHSPPSTIRGRKTSSSKVGFTNTAAISEKGSALHSSVPGKTPRPRTSSKASTVNSRSFASSGSTGSVTVSAISGTSSFLSDHTQKGLEMVIDSRLLETCLVLTVAEPGRQNQSGPLSPHSTPTTPDFKGKSPTAPKSASHIKSQFRPLGSSRTPSISGSPHHARTSSESSTPIEAQKPRLTDGQRGRPTNSGQVRLTTTVSPRARSKPSKPNGMSLDLSPVSPEPTCFHYRSPVHRPSTNPEFVVDTGFLSRFAEWVSLNAQTLRITIWGKMPAYNREVPSGQEFGSSPYPDEPGFRWKVLDTWDVHLDELVPIPDETKRHSEFPSNTLLLTLSPQGQTYCLSRQEKASRPPSPSVGYSSDPETTAHNGSWPEQDVEESGDIDDISSSKHRRRRVIPANPDYVSNTATWPDIFQLATLQACIADNNVSLDAVTRKIDQLVEADDVLPLRRAITERQDRIGDLRKDQHTIIELCSRKRLEIQERRAELDRRREYLSIAREETEEFEIARHGELLAIASEGSSIAALRSNLSSIRACLISVLAEIFPIDLISPPDLLFTILDVPLPIPVSGNAPAPPLSLPERQDVNEDAVATALGYVAEVLQLLSAYLGTSLMYPVTCIGSRSLIRDGISSIVGPRTFPLYSKGVDTYRFEYGVFLLNKNIEILMAEKDLRALDVRHTLPNLKNLLLILSHDSSGRSEFRKRKPPETPGSSILELDPEYSSAVDGSGGATPKPNTPGDLQTPPRSGTTTPTPVNPDDSRKSRSFLGLTPLAGFLRGRYPSSRDASDSTDDVDDEDRRTIQGVNRDENEPRTGHEPSPTSEESPTSE